MIPLTISMSDRDNVAIVANDGGLPAGAKPVSYTHLTLPTIYSV